MSADESMGVYVDIRGNADSLVHAAGEGESSIKGLEGVSKEALATLSAAISKLDLDFVKWTETSRGTEAQVKKTAETAKSEGSQLESFSDRLLQHNYAVARGLEAAGLSAEASAARVGGALEAVKTAMSGLNPVLLAVTAGAGAMFAGFELLKSSAEAASKWQQNLALLGQTVRNQGGDWNKLSESVKEWADLQEKTTTFSRDEAVGALRLLTSAGTDLSDAMKMVRVAEDAAAATGHSLSDVVHGLMEAEHGRTQILAELGIGTRAQIKDGMTLSQVLQEIEDHMGGAAAAAADTYSGKVSQLSNAVEALKEDLGEHLLPTMSKAVDGIRAWVDVADKRLPDLVQRFNDAKDAAGGFIGFISDHRDVVSYFFDVIIGVQAIRALAAATKGFYAMRDATLAWAGTVPALRAAALILGLEGGGIVAGARAAAAALYGLATSEAAATLGLSALAALVVGGGIYAFTHWKDTVHTISQALDDIAGWMDKVGDIGTALSATILGWIPGINKLGDAWHWAAQKLREYAQSKRDAVDDTGPSQISQRMSVDEEIIASGGKKDITPGTAGWTVDQARADLQEALSLMGGTPRNSADTHVKKNTKIGTGGGSQSVYQYSPTPYDVKSTPAIDQHSDVVSKMLEQLKVRESELTEKVNEATTAAQKHTAELALNAQKAKDAQEAIAILTRTVAYDEGEQKKAAAAVSETAKRYKAAVDALNAFNKAHDGKVLTKDEQEQQKKLSQAVTDTKTAYDNANTSLDHVNQTLKTHIQQLQQARIAANDLKNATAELKEKWDAFFQQHQRQLNEDLSTSNMTNAQKYEYFKRLFDATNRDTAEGEQLAEYYYGKMTEAYKGALTDQENAAKKQHDEQVKLIEDWANKGVELFNSFFEKGKGGFKSFADAFKKMLDDMLVALERSALTNLLAKIFGVNLGTGAQSGVPGGLSLPGGGGGVPGAGGGASSFLSLLGFGAAGGAAPSLQSQANAMLDFSPSAAFNGAGIPGGTAAIPGGGGATSSNTGLLGLLHLKAGMGTASNPGLGAYAAAAAGGALIGQTVFGGKGYADVGGALGATAALALAGPAGWGAIALMTLGGALIGAGGGSLFGNHFDPANEPDIYQQDAWGQSNADMNGNTSASPMMANGKPYVMDSWTQQATHGKGWNLTFEKFVQLFRGKTNALPSNLRSAFSRIEQLWGGATNQPNFNHDGKDGYLDIGSGARAKWTEFWQYVTQFGPQISQMVDQYQNTDVYTSSNGTATAAGSYTPSGSPFMLHDFPDYGAPYVSVSPSGGGGAPVPDPGGGNPPANPDPGGASPRHGPVRESQHVTVINQYVQGNVVTEKQLYQNASTAAGRNARTATVRRLNGVGKY